MARRRPRRPLTAYQAAAIRYRACGRKRRYPSRAAALRNLAAMILDGRDVRGQRPYRCPFRAPGGPFHWHHGRPPTLEALERIAAAIRFGPLPDEVQHPRTGEWSRVDPYTGASMGPCPPPTSSPGPSRP